MVKISCLVFSIEVNCVVFSRENCAGLRSHQHCNPKTQGGNHCARRRNLNPNSER